MPSTFLPSAPPPQYEGTHNFHNFTIRTPATAPNAKRFMLSFRCGSFVLGWCASLGWCRRGVVPGGGRCQHCTNTNPHMLGAALAPACRALQPCHACICLGHARAHSMPAGWHDCLPLRASCRSCPGVFEIDGQRWVRLVVIGQSFMLHQIRKMVGAAVAVARGSLPFDLLEASLATPARMNLPLAPPSTLMLVGAQFRWGQGLGVGTCAGGHLRLPSPAAHAWGCGLACPATSAAAPPLPPPSPASSPFQRSWSGAAAHAAQWTGDTLELKAAGAAAQQAFLRGVMLPRLDALLAGEEWAQWEVDLERMWWDEGERRQLLAAHAEWAARRAETREQARLERLLEEAAGQDARNEDCT